MKKYDSYKDSGIEWIGEIPSHWDIQKLKFICKIFNGDSLKDEEKELYSLENENSIPYVSTKDIDVSTSKINYENGLSIPFNHKKYKIAPKNSFLICIEGGSAGRKYGFLEKDVFFVNKLACFTTNSENNKFLYYYSQSPLFQLQFQNSLSGLIGGVAISQIRNFSSILPNYIEQTTIANYLDQKTTQIDHLITKKEQLIQLLEEERVAVINQAVTKGLDPTVPMKDSGIEWLGEIPEHWEVKKFGFIFKSLNTKRIPLSAEERGVMESRIFDYYGASGVIDKVENFLFDEDLILIGEDGANLLTRSKRLVFIASGKYWVNNHAHIIKPINGNINYYCEFLELIDYSVYVSGSAQPKLTQEALMSIKIIEPPLKEQSNIYSFIKTETEKIDTIITKTQQEIELLKEYKTALVSEVVTGKVDVRGK